jgi:hypothetical protein
MPNSPPGWTTFEEYRKSNPTTLPKYAPAPHCPPAANTEEMEQFRSDFAAFLLKTCASCAHHSHTFTCLSKLSHKDLDKIKNMITGRVDFSLVTAEICRLGAPWPLCPETHLEQSLEHPNDAQIMQKRVYPLSVQTNYVLGALCFCNSKIYPFDSSDNGLTAAMYCLSYQTNTNKESEYVFQSLAKAVDKIDKRMSFDPEQQLTGDKIARWTLSSIVGNKVVTANQVALFLAQFPSMITSRTLVRIPFYLWASFLLHLDGIPLYTPPPLTPKH